MKISAHKCWMVRARNSMRLWSLLWLSKCISISCDIPALRSSRCIFIFIPQYRSIATLTSLSGWGWQTTAAGLSVEACSHYKLLVTLNQLDVGVCVCKAFQYTTKNALFCNNKRHSKHATVTVYIQNCPLKWLRTKSN